MNSNVDLIQKHTHTHTHTESGHLVAQSSWYIRLECQYMRVFWLELEWPSGLRNVPMWGRWLRWGMVWCEMLELTWGEKGILLGWGQCGPSVTAWQGEHAVHTEKWLIRKIRTQAGCGVFTLGKAQHVLQEHREIWVCSGCHREEKMAVVLVSWLYTGRLSKYVTSQAMLCPVWTHPSSLFGLQHLTPGQLSVWTALSHPMALGLSYLGRKREKEKYFLNNLIFCYLLLVQSLYSFISCPY